MPSKCGRAFMAKGGLSVVFETARLAATALAASRTESSQQQDEEQPGEDSPARR